MTNDETTSKKTLQEPTLLKVKILYFTRHPLNYVLLQ